eukprot:scaffold14619_cov146-Amphora_coffeaeformis.AAC.7
MDVVVDFAWFAPSTPRLKTVHHFSHVLHTKKTLARIKKPHFYFDSAFLSFGSVRDTIMQITSFLRIPLGLFVLLLVSAEASSDKVQLAGVDGDEIQLRLVCDDVGKLIDYDFPSTLGEVGPYLEALLNLPQNSSGNSTRRHLRHNKNINMELDRRLRKCNNANDRRSSLQFDSYLFSEDDKQMIRELLEMDFNGFAIDFVLQKPDDGCDYSTLSFSPPDGVVTLGNRCDGKNDILFGRADKIDFRNRDHADNAFVDASLWTWILQFPFFLDPVASFFSLSGLDPSMPVEDALRMATINQIFLDYGIINDGLVDLAAADQTGSETLLHIMASGGGVNLPLSVKSSQDLFLSERSAIKLLIGSKVGNDFTYTEANAQKDGKSIGSKHPGLKLKQLTVPNTIVKGALAGKNLATSVAIVEGASLASSSEVDQYRFFFEKGQFINVEVISFIDYTTKPEVGIDQAVIAGVSVYRDNGGNLEHVFTSYQEFEGFDPLIFDLEMVQAGNYVIEVFPQKFVCLGSSTCFPLTGVNEVFNSGMYDMLVYSIDGALGPA